MIKAIILFLLPLLAHAGFPPIRSTGQNYINTAPGQVIVANPIDLTSNVTGVLPPSNGGMIALSASSPLVYSLGNFSCSVASGSQAGCLSSSDWNTFNNKQPAGSYVLTSRLINTTAPLTGGGSLASDLTLSMPQATSSVSGYLSSTDWTTFNNKLSSLIKMNVITVDKSGNDTTCVANDISKPCLTIAKAVTLISSPTSNNRFQIKVGVGRFDETAFNLYPYTWFVGSDGILQGGNTRITVASNQIGLDSSWSTGSQRGGMANIYMTGSTGLNLDFQAISATSSHVIELTNVGMNGNLIFKSNSGTLDFLDAFGIRIFGSVTVSGGSFSFIENQIQGNLTVDNSGSQNFDGDYFNGLVAGNITANQTGGNTTSLRLRNVNNDGVISKTGTASILTNLSSYIPSTPANWTSVPTRVDSALDNLASSVAGLGMPTYTTVTTTPYTVTTERFINSNVASASVLNLPTAIGNTGKTISVKMINAQSVVITPFGAETIDGQSSLTIVNQNDAPMLVSNGSNWYLN